MAIDGQTHISFLDRNDIETGPSAERDLSNKEKVLKTDHASVETL